MVYKVWIYLFHLIPNSLIDQRHNFRFSYQFCFIGQSLIKARVNYGAGDQTVPILTTTWIVCLFGRMKYRKYKPSLKLQDFLKNANETKQTWNSIFKIFNFIFCLFLQCVCLCAHTCAHMYVFMSTSIHTYIRRQLARIKLRLTGLAAGTH